MKLLRIIILCITSIFLVTSTQVSAETSRFEHRFNDPSTNFNIIFDYAYYQGYSLSLFNHNDKEFWDFSPVAPALIIDGKTYQLDHYLKQQNRASIIIPLDAIINLSTAKNVSIQAFFTNKSKVLLPIPNEQLYQLQQLINLSDPNARFNYTAHEEGGSLFVKYFYSNNSVQFVSPYITIKQGQRLNLIPVDDAPRWYASSETDQSVIEFAHDSNFISVIGLKPGVTKIYIFPRHNYPAGNYVYVKVVD